MLRLLLLFLVLTSAALGLEIKEVRWGFDGRVLAGRFNLCSVLVAEPGPQPFEGELVLREQHGGIETGAPLVQPIFLSPGTSRWVQFLPFLGGEESWRLIWGRGEKQRYDFNAPTKGPPATVLLLDTNSVFANSASLRGFPEELFPTSVAATDGLDQIAIDHPPRWDAPRREAFLDWVRRGGVVHLLRGPEGPPRFEGDLAVLAGEQPKTRLGAGSILRHEGGRAEFTEQVLTGKGWPVRALNKSDNPGISLYRLDQSLLRGMASLTKPDVQWWFLYLLTIAYLVAIGPVHYRWSRRTDYRLALAGFLGIVAAFSLAFLIGGHRGSGEKQTSHSLAVAHRLGGGRWDVQQWISAFATRGGHYRLTHPAPANFYSASNDSEAVPGRIVSGREGYFEVDMPLFSTRPFLHRGVLAGPEAAIKVLEWKGDRVELETGEDFPVSGEPIYARFLERGWEFRRQGNRLSGTAMPGSPEGPWAFISSARIAELQQQEWGQGHFNPRAAHVPLLAWFLGDAKGPPSSSRVRPLAPDHLQLFVFAPSPPAFSVQGPGFQRGPGHTLYVLDVFRPDATPPEPATAADPAPLEPR